MLFSYPSQAAFNRPIPKAKFYERAKLSPSVKARFVSEMSQVVWSYKLAPETINIIPSEAIQEIQVFSVTLKGDTIDEGVLRAIDRSIPSPIIFEVYRAKEARTVAAFKRPSESDSASWVVADYFQSAWSPSDSDRRSLPLALNMGSLYEQILRTLAPIEGRPDEPLQALSDRYAVLRAKHLERERLSAKLKAEKQFNRKVELNALVRQIEAEISDLSDSEQQIIIPTE
jgi:hypothetical protein